MRLVGVIAPGGWDGSVPFGPPDMGPRQAMPVWEGGLTIVGAILIRVLNGHLSEAKCCPFNVDVSSGYRVITSPPCFQGFVITPSMSEGDITQGCHRYSLRQNWAPRGGVRYGSYNTVSVYAYMYVLRTVCGDYRHRPVMPPLTTQHLVGTVLYSISQRIGSLVLSRLAVIYHPMSNLESPSTEQDLEQCISLAFVCDGMLYHLDRRPAVLIGKLRVRASRYQP